MSQKNDTDSASVPDVSIVAEERAGEDQAGDLVSYLHRLSLAGWVQANGFH